MPVFNVPLVKTYFRKSRPENTFTAEGRIPIEAEDMAGAKRQVEEMIRMNYQPDAVGMLALKTTDPRIEWDDDHPGIGWVYEDFSFGIDEYREDDE